jgi:hypothetical protein
MSALKVFSSVTDLAPLLDLGGKVVFRWPMAAMGFCSRTPANFPWDIKIATSALFHPPDYQASHLEMLKAQKMTLIHEFLHLYNGDHLKPVTPCRLGKDPYETAVEKATARFFRGSDSEVIVRDLVEELLLRPNCSFIYEVAEDYKTPFFRYQTRLASLLLKEINGQIPLHGGERRLKLLAQYGPAAKDRLYSLLR